MNNGQDILKHNEISCVSENCKQGTYMIWIYKICVYKVCICIQNLSAQSILCSTQKITSLALMHKRSLIGIAMDN